jgi:hypothetical protein
MAKSCLGGRVKRSILFHILLNKEPSLVAGLSQTALGGNRNPEESGEESGVNTGIPAKNSCGCEKKQKFLRPLQNHVPVKNSSGKHRKIILRNPGRNIFFIQKMNSLKTGITNLALVACQPCLPTLVA